MSMTPGSGRKRKSSSRKVMMHKRKSLRSQHSMSLHIPIDELSSRNSGFNCYLDLPEQVFSLTYLESNETNPESLAALNCLKNVRWQACRVGFLYNMDYKNKTLRALENSIENAFKRNTSPDVSFHCEVTVVENLSVTENDNEALQIIVKKRSAEKQTTVYNAFIMSWCNPVKQKETFLPLMMVRSGIKNRAVVNSVLRDRHGVNVTPLVLPQDDFQHLTTYCTILMDESDDYEVTTSYKIPPGTIKLSASVPSLLKVWKTIHQDESNEVDIDEILHFKYAMEAFYESVYGLKLGRAHYDEFTIKHCCSIRAKGLVWFNSTKTIHVVLKYLNYLIAQQFKLKVFEQLGESVSTTAK